MQTWVFVKDDFVQADKAAIPYRDLAIERGYGVFDFFRLVGHEPLFLSDHLDRFYCSAAGLGLAVPDRSFIMDAILALIRRNNQPGSGLRLTLTGGESPDGLSAGRPNLVISQEPFTPPTAAKRQAGIRLLTYPYQRTLPQWKTTNYLMAVWLQPQLRAQGADDVLYHHNNLLSECPRSNFFLVTADETLVTPMDGILPGITRKKLMDLARNEFPVKEGPLSLADIATAKEAFITSTTKGVLPVAAIDQTVFGSTRIGCRLHNLFCEHYGG